MAGLSNLAFMATAMQGIRQSADRMRELRTTQAEQKRKDELFKIEKQKSELEIKKLETEGAMSSLELEITRKALKDQFGIADTVSKAQTASINQEIYNEKQRATSLAGVLKNSAEDFQDETGLAVSIPGMQIGMKKKVGPFILSTPSAPGATINDARDRALGSLKAGGVMSGSALERFSSREDADAFAMQHLGPDYERNYPQAKAYITKHFGSGEYTVGQTITTKKGKVRVTGFDVDGQPLIEPVKKR